MAELAHTKGRCAAEHGFVVRERGVCVHDARAARFVVGKASRAPKIWSAGSATGAPESKNSGGTYGRWRYAREYNVFILVNSVDENVHFYKHTEGCGPAQP